MASSGLGGGVAFLLAVGSALSWALLAGGVWGLAAVCFS
jgi:hypothetical protein